MDVNFSWGNLCELDHVELGLAPKICHANICVLSVHCRILNYFQTRLGEESNYLSSSLIAAVRKADSKLVFIPVVFVLLRMWGTIEFFYTISLPTHDACIPTKFHSGLVFLGVMQVSKHIIMRVVRVH